MAIEGMIEFLINGYLNAMTPEVDLFGEVIGISISWFCIIICSAAFPLSNFILAMMKDEIYLRKKRFKRVAGSLFEGIKTHDKW